MNTPAPLACTRRNRIASFLLGFFPVWLSASAVFAQAVSSTQPPTATDASATAAEVVELSPFAVLADGNDSYTALNTNSVTRFRAELAKLPVTADVFTEKFMEDIAALSIEEMVIEYGTGTGVGGANPSGRPRRTGRATRLPM